MSDSLPLMFLDSQCVCLLQGVDFNQAQFQSV